MVTAFDGAPMARKGEGAKALGTGIFFSFLGTIFGLIALMIIAPYLAAVAIKFGAFEYCALSIFSLSLVISLAGKDMVKGLAAALLGVIFATFGISAFDSIVRYDFGSVNMQSGITSMEDLLEKSKANPGTIKMGMSSGGNTHVYALLLQQAGFDCNIVDGGDGSDRIAALVGGHVDVCFVPYLTAKEYIENGDVTPLCTIGDRCSALPDTPSINEGGYVKNNFNGCYIWMAPKGTDAGIVSYLASLCEDVVNNNAKYDEDQRAINFNDPFIVTGQDALDFLEELQQTAIENVGVLG